MMHSSINSARRETLNLRIKPDKKGLIDRAVRAKGKNRTDSILEAARAAAQEVLVEQIIITTDPKAYIEFLNRLDMPPKQNERLADCANTGAMG